jgi:hypothetical protein
MVSALASEREWRNSMKNVSMAIGFVSAVLLAAPGSAENIGIVWTSGVAAGNGWLPKMASDGQVGKTTLIYQIDTDMARFEYENGYFNIYSPWMYWTFGPDSILSSSDPSKEIGHAPDIAMVTCPLAGCAATPYAAAISNVVEVHQGGPVTIGPIVVPGSAPSLWYRTGVTVPSSGATSWATASSYDAGYNPRVAVDQYKTWGGSTTVIEVHQAGVDMSDLWYHVGTLTYSASSVSITWGPSKKTGLTGYSPSVSISNGVVALVARGPFAELWYSIGTLDTSGNVTWGTATNYTTGYNPSVSIQACGGGGTTPNAFNCLFLLAETHQSGNDTGTLYFRTGILKGVTPGSTSITWTKDIDRTIGPTGSPVTGCYPTVSLITNWSTSSGYYYVAESNSVACGGPANLQSWFGALQLE